MPSGTLALFGAANAIWGAGFVRRLGETIWDTGFVRRVDDAIWDLCIEKGAAQCTRCC